MNKDTVNVACLGRVLRDTAETCVDFHNEITRLRMELAREKRKNFELSNQIEEYRIKFQHQLRKENHG